MLELEFYLISTQRINVSPGRNPTNNSQLMTRFLSYSKQVKNKRTLPKSAPKSLIPRMNPSRFAYSPLARPMDTLNSHHSHPTAPLSSGPSTPSSSASASASSSSASGSAPSEPHTCPPTGSLKPTTKAETLSIQRKTTSTISTSCDSISKPLDTVAADALVVVGGGDGRGGASATTWNSSFNAVRSTTAPPNTSPKLSRQQQEQVRAATQLQQKGLPLVKEQTLQSTTFDLQSSNKAPMAVTHSTQQQPSRAIVIDSNKQPQAESQTQPKAQAQVQVNLQQQNQQQTSLSQHVELANARVAADATINSVPQQRRLPNMKVRPKRNGRVVTQFGQMQLNKGSESDPVVIEDESSDTPANNNCEKNISPNNVETTTTNNETKTIVENSDANAKDTNNTSIACKSSSESSKAADRIIGYSPPKSIQNIQKTVIGSINNTNKNNNNISNSTNNNIINNPNAQTDAAPTGRRISELRLDLSPRLIKTINEKQSQTSTSPKKLPSELPKKPETEKQTQNPQANDPQMIPSSAKAPIPGSAAAAVVQATGSITQAKETTISSAPRVTKTLATPTLTAPSSSSPAMASTNKTAINGRSPVVLSTQAKTSSMKVQNGTGQMPQNVPMRESASEKALMTEQNESQNRTVQNKSRESVNPKLASPNKQQPTETTVEKPNSTTTKPPDTIAKVTQQPTPTATFNWDIYLKLSPEAEVAPHEAFMQSKEQLLNGFKPDMRLEARDPRNNTSWCLANVIATYGPRIKLRLDGEDASNDFWELVDSENIRSVGSGKGKEPILPPMGFKTGLSRYTKFVEDLLAKSLIAPPNLFIPPPPKPAKNMFKVGMKLEAVDRKNPYMICPATVNLVEGDELRVSFDGWSGSFNYRCKYYSRDIFPVKWCDKNKHFISAPKGWEKLLTNTSQPTKERRASTSTPKPVTPMPMPKQIKSRPRGRPPKSAELSKTHSHGHTSTHNTSNSTSTPNLKLKSRPGPASSKINNGEPRKSLDREHTKVNKEAPHISTLEDEAQEIEDDEPLPAGTNKFQCRRAMSYFDWQKEKNSSPQKSTAPSATPDEDETTSTTAIRESPSPIKSPSLSKSLPTAPVNLVDKPQVPTNSAASVSLDEDGHISKKSKLKLETESREVLPGTFSHWTVTNVLDFIKRDETLAKYAKVFENHEIDGKAFLLLTTDVMIKHMGLKIGPVLKINDMIEKVKRGHKLQ